MRQNRIRIAIQKEGRLKEQSLNFLLERGLKLNKQTNRGLIVPCENENIEIVYVRHNDIPTYVQYCAADFGIVGENVLFETNFNLKVIKRLGFGKCKLVVAAPVNSQIKNVENLEGERISTSYPNSLKKFLKDIKINACVIEIHGAVEITPALNLSDAICDLIQTGNTLKDNNLKIIADVFKSEAVLIESPLEKKDKKDLLAKFFGL